MPRATALPRKSRTTSPGVAPRAISVPTSRRRSVTLPYMAPAVAAPPTPSRSPRKASDRCPMVRLTSCWVRTTWAMVTTRASGSFSPIFSTRPAAICLQQPTTSMAFTTSPLPARRCTACRWAKTRASSTVPVGGSTARTVNRSPSNSTPSPSFNPARAAASAPTRTSPSASVSITRLRASVRGSGAAPTGRSASAPQPAGREKMPAPRQAAFAWNSLRGRMPVSVTTRPPSAAGTHSRGERLSTPSRPDRVSRSTYSSGSVSPCRSAA